MGTLDSMTCLYNDMDPIIPYIPYFPLYILRIWGPFEGAI